MGYRYLEVGQSQSVVHLPECEAQKLAMYHLSIHSCQKPCQTSFLGFEKYPRDVLSTGEKPPKTSALMGELDIDLRLFSTTTATD